MSNKLYRTTRRPPATTRAQVLGAIKAKPGITKAELARKFDTVEMNIATLLSRLKHDQLAHSRPTDDPKRRGWFPGAEAVGQPVMRVSSVFDLGRLAASC